MCASYLMGIDIGTSGARAAIFDVNGDMVSLKRCSYTFAHPQSGWSEIDPELVWQQIVKAVRGAVEDSGLHASEVAAIGISAIGETAMLTDDDGHPVYPAIESIDQRANAYSEYVQWLNKRIGAEDIFKSTSYPLSSLAPPSKILWLRDHQPALFDNPLRLLTFQDFVVWRLTGAPVIDQSMASRTMLYDVHQRRWNDEYLSLLGLSQHQVSPVTLATEVAGRLSAKTAEHLGLAPGTPVVPGAHDQSCAALAVGVVREGIAGDGTGSFEAVATVTKLPIADPAMMHRGQGSQCHVSNDTYLALGFHLSAGSLVNWYREELGEWADHRAKREGKDPFDLITEEASQSKPGANGLLVLPHWSGAGTGRVPALNPNSRGAILGLTLGHKRADIGRAIFEGITLETRFIVESLQQAGQTIEELVVTGGGARSAFWLQLKADIMGRRVMRPAVTEASLLGAAMLAGVGIGIYQDIHKAVERTFRLAASYDPHPKVQRSYDRLYAIYCDLYESTEEMSQRLAEFARETA